MSESQDTLYIVIPAYNERENIQSCINDWYPIVAAHNGGGASRLVIVDDGSKDNTYQLLLHAAKTRPLLVPLTKENGGHGAAVLYGYRYALEHNAGYIFQTDSDGQTNPAEFEQFWAERRSYAAIIGNRVVRGDGPARKFVENTVCFLLRLYFGVRVKDANAPFRLMSHDVLARHIGRMPADFNLPNIMLTTYFAYFHERLKFVPITFAPRTAGTNTINVRRIVGIGWHALGDFHRLRAELKSN